MNKQPNGVPHKHAAVIKAWADGAEIECRTNPTEKWFPICHPNWYNGSEYRVKPMPHKWQKEMDACTAGKTIEWASSWGTPYWAVWFTAPEAGMVHWNNPAYLFRIKPDRVSFVCKVEVLHGFSPKITASQNGEKPTSATWHENLKLTFEDGELIEATVLPKVGDKK